VAFQKSKIYNSDIQIWAMKQHYPQFKSKKRDRYDIEFIGTLKVKPELPTYTVSVKYRGSKTPIVKVISPVLTENAPHTYPSEKNLCLYHPNNFNWQREKLISKEIMDWTAAWIYFYEVWLQTGVWYGPEAAHDIPKELNDE
jgi:hypothetical protein